MRRRKTHTRNEDERWARLDRRIERARHELARLVKGTICLVIGERARHSQVCSIENRDIYSTYVIFALMT